MLVTVSECNCTLPDTVVYDVSALSWVINWPSDNVKRHVYFATFKPFVCKALQVGNVTLVFDRNYVGSEKTSMRMQRAGPSRVHKLTPDVPTPSKQVTLSVTQNKIQLNVGRVLDQSEFLSKSH